MRQMMMQLSLVYGGQATLHWCGQNCLSFDRPPPAVPTCETRVTVNEQIFHICYISSIYESSEPLCWWIHFHTDYTLCRCLSFNCPVPIWDSRNVTAISAFGFLTKLFYREKASFPCYTVTVLSFNWLSCSLLRLAGMGWLLVSPNFLKVFF